MTPTGFAIIGTGDAACSHAAVLQRCPTARLVACVSRRSDAAKRFAAQFDCRGEIELERVLQDPAIAAVIVATEPGRHNVAISVARACRHVLIEKPLAASCDSAVDIVNACRESKITAGVVSQHRFADGFEVVRNALTDGAIGAPVFAEFTNLASRPDEYFAAGNGWRRGLEGGITMNLLIHGIDRLLCLFGRVTSVQATMTPSPSTARPDRRATLVLSFENGTHAVVRGSSEFRRTWGEVLGIHGESGRLRMQNGGVTLVRHPLGVERPREQVRQFVVDLFSRLREKTGVRRPDSRVRQLEDFINAVQMGRQPSVTLEDGLSALRVVKAAHEAAACGRAVLLVGGVAL